MGLGLCLHIVTREKGHKGQALPHSHEIFKISPFCRFSPSLLLFHNTKTFSKSLRQDAVSLSPRRCALRGPRRLQAYVDRNDSPWCEHEHMIPWTGRIGARRNGALGTANAILLVWLRFLAAYCSVWRQNMCVGGIDRRVRPRMSAWSGDAGGAPRSPFSIFPDFPSHTPQRPRLPCCAEPTAPVCTRCRNPVPACICSRLAISGMYMRVSLRSCICCWSQILPAKTNTASTASGFLH